MNASSRDMPVKYHVEISPVREVTLVGTADLGFWKSRLQAEGLYPTNRDGRAQLLISAVEGKFKGIKFRELSISVSVARQQDRAEWDAAYLVHAYNSLRFFAFVERMFFHTPYWPGQIAVETRPVASFQVSKKGRVLLRTEMVQPGTTTRATLRHGHESWAGPIFLPSRSSASGADGKLFFGKLSGDTEVYAFDPAHDTITLGRSPDDAILEWLDESQFIGQEWMIRECATHGKSKTIGRRGFEFGVS